MFLTCAMMRHFLSVPTEQVLALDFAPAQREHFGPTLNPYLELVKQRSILCVRNNLAGLNRRMEQGG